MLSPYNSKTEETRNRILGKDRQNYFSYRVNNYYRSAEGNFYFYINSKGFYHIVRPCRIKYDGVFSHYEIVDYLLTKDDTLKETKCCGNYKTKEECIAKIEENLA